MPKTAAKTTVKAEVKVKAASKPATAGMNLAVFAMDGSKKGTVALSKEIFGVKPNTELMAQAVRVYLVNQRQGTASTKTRGEVRGSTRKIYRQKGTGRARHGAIKAPIFVGGGIAFGPHPRNFELKMSKQMRQKALFSALSQMLAAEKVLAVDAAAASGKTKEMSNLLSKIAKSDTNKTSKVLFVAKAESAVRAAKNLEGVSIVPGANLNTYEVLNSNFILFEKDQIAHIEEVFLKTK